MKYNLFWRSLSVTVLNQENVSGLHGVMLSKSGYLGNILFDSFVENRMKHKVTVLTVHKITFYYKNVTIF